MSTQHELRRRIDMIRENLREGAAGHWQAMGYDAETRTRCRKDAGANIQRLKAELRALRAPRKPRKPYTRRHA